MISYRKYIEDGRLNLSVLSEHRGKALRMEENHRENFCLPVIYCSMLIRAEEREKKKHGGARHAFSLWFCICQQKLDIKISICNCTCSCRAIPEMEKIG